MLVKNHEAIKTIEDKMEFKFEDLELIGYTKMYFEFAIYKDCKNIFIFKLNKNVVLNIICVDNIEYNKPIFYPYTALIFGNKEYRYNYKYKIGIYKDHNEITFDLIKNGNEEKVFTANENLQLSDEEMITLKLGGYFLNEEELAKGWKIWTIEIK